jgi:hypothetical protein
VRSLSVVTSSSSLLGLTLFAVLGAACSSTAEPAAGVELGADEVGSAASALARRDDVPGTGGGTGTTGGTPLPDAGTVKPDASSPTTPTTPTSPMVPGHILTGPGFTLRHCPPTTFDVRRDSASCGPAVGEGGTWSFTSLFPSAPPVVRDRFCRYTWTPNVCAPVPLDPTWTFHIQPVPAIGLGQRDTWTNFRAVGSDPLATGAPGAVVAAQAPATRAAPLGWVPLPGGGSCEVCTVSILGNMAYVVLPGATTLPYTVLVVTRPILGHAKAAQPTDPWFVTQARGLSSFTVQLPANEDWTGSTGQVFDVAQDPLL